jgi:antitoxin (DNA-binding transcriptional repressor) of toxin-antitoxin stability system
MNISIGSYEAKTKLPELLRGVQLGNRYTITLRGEVVALLIPSGKNQKNNVAKAVTAMHRFMQSHSPILQLDTKAMIEYGRD